MSRGKRRREPEHRWPWSRSMPRQSPEVQSARAGRVQAEADLQRTRELAADVTSVTEKLRKMREDNHLTQVFTRALGDHR